MENAIDITSVDLIEFIKTAYDLSRPQGLGFIHFVEGRLPDDAAKALIFQNERDGVVVHMDYVKGRAVKMAVFRENGKLFIYNHWYDHTPEDLHQLLASVGIAHEPATA